VSEAGREVDMAGRRTVAKGCTDSPCLFAIRLNAANWALLRIMKVTAAPGTSSSKVPAVWAVGPEVSPGVCEGFSVGTQKVDW